ncbi:hypothetical protein [Roseomonas haemaphysalidis]|uniref:Uncharacterized protein n=1 Tax=Roseomonas haemaphysalidis TaxID=2768162 RepID=A0ABS3KKV1_9PROT|nr:hypothetical protein [Roseomonas haemaphysalidis]MBO1078099.1 hypothetical protein [Roseomonas haemaphysalidis]
MPTARYANADRTDVLLIQDDGLRLALKPDNPLLDGTEIGPYEPPELPVPDLTPLQLRQGLLGAGMLDEVETLIAAGAVELRLAYNHASIFERHHPMIEALADQIGLSDAAVDHLFRAAAAG